MHSQAVEAGALEALEAGAARIRAALGASAVSADGLRAAFLSPDEWLPGAAVLAGLSLPASAATCRSEEPTYTAASIDGQQDVSELAAALALTQQVSVGCRAALAPRSRDRCRSCLRASARRRTTTSCWPPPMRRRTALASRRCPRRAATSTACCSRPRRRRARCARSWLAPGCVSCRACAAQASRVSPFSRRQEALAASTAKHDAVLAERDAARAERDRLQAERDAFAAQHGALCDERDALLEERDALRLQVYSPGVFVDASVSPLRAAAVELNAHVRSKSGAAVRTGELAEDAGGPASGASLAAQSGSPRRGSGQRAPEGPDGTVSRLLARMGLSGEAPRLAE